MSELRFAVVREDPEVEALCVQRFGLKRALVCASGGCTALALKHRFPELSVTAYDINPAQIEHLGRKVKAIADRDLDALNIEDPSVLGLSQCGEFEKLFRVLRYALQQLVADPAEVRRYFDPGCPSAEALSLAARWVGSRYWPSVFAMVFCDAALLAMFGPDAVQHGPAGSYPGHFQRAFERGLTRGDGPRNYFLQSVFLTCYRFEDAPDFLRAGRVLELTPELGGVADITDLGRFDLVHLSNIFDWSSESMARVCALRLRELAPGAVITLRQLNNQRALRPLFEPYFVFDDELSRALAERDRSLFYNRIELGVRSGVPG